MLTRAKARLAGWLRSATVARSRAATFTCIICHLLLLLQTFIANIFSIPDGSEGNQLFSYVCISTDSFDTIFMVTALVLIWRMPGTADLLVMEMISLNLVLLGVLKLGALVVLVQGVDQVDYRVDYRVARWLETYLVVLLILRLVSQTATSLALCSLVIAAREVEGRVARGASLVTLKHQGS